MQTTDFYILCATYYLLIFINTKVHVTKILIGVKFSAKL